MEAATHTPPEPGTRPGVWEDKITGLYRRFTVHQLALAWWCYREKHISKRQLRVFFAAAEMDERRQWTKPQPGEKGGRRPLYELDEIRCLIGSANTKTANAALSADVKKLGRLGLVEISSRRITFAASVDQISVDDISSFWTMFNLIKNNRRMIPMPRRTCRALAAGLQPAVMATMIALMMRGLYWHRASEKGQGGYRVDGRCKRSWISDVFGVSERAVTNARARLMELGWLRPLESQQWQLNRYGSRDQINVHAFGPKPDARRAFNTAADAGQSASPQPDNSGQSASPCLDNSAFPDGKDLNTRRPAPMRAGPAGVSIETHAGKARRQGGRKSTPSGQPKLHDIQRDDLHDTSRLLELHRQAIQAGRAKPGEAGRLDFLSLAERARSSGNNPPKLFAWLLKHQRFDFIAQANEDAAASRLRELKNGPCDRGRGVDPLHQTPKPRSVELTEDDKVVIACLQTAKQHRGVEPSDLARRIKGWTACQWESAHFDFQEKSSARWR